MYVTAVRCGVRPDQFWDMTIGEISDSIEQYMYMKEQDTNITKAALESVLSYIGRMTHELPILVNKALMGSKKYPDITEYLPEDVAAGIRQKRQKDPSLMFLYWAESVNARMAKSEAAKIDKLARSEKIGDQR